PLAVERLPDALPRTLSMRQIIDYSQSVREAAFALAGALGTIPPAPPVPEQLPEPPAAPLSYLSDLVEQVGQPEPLTQQQQHQILIQLEPAQRSPDAEERRGGRYVLEMFSRRWAEAVERFETLQASFPGEGRVETRLNEARRQRDIAFWSARPRLPPLSV